jgi:hypothetical protein
MCEVYRRHRAAIEGMLDPRKWPIAWLDAEIEAGRATVFGTERACIVAKLQQYPGMLIEVHALCAAGDLAVIASEVRPQVEAWGASFGAEVASAESRPEWARVLAKHGYRETQRRVEKELS